MGDEEEMTPDAKKALSAVSEECLKRFPQAILTAELVGINDNEVKVTMINDGIVFDGKVRVSVARSEINSWLNRVEAASEQHS